MPSSRKRKVKQQRSPHSNKYGNFDSSSKLQEKGRGFHSNSDNSQSRAELQVQVRPNQSDNDKNETEASSVCQEQNLIKFLNQVLTENRSIAHRLAAVELMCQELEEILAEDVYSQALSWITHLVKTIELCKDGAVSLLALTCHTLSQLLVKCSKCNELRRSISINFIPKLLSLLLSIDCKDMEAVGLVSIVNLMKMCIKYFGGSCLSFKNKVESFVLGVVFSQQGNSSVIQICTSTLSYLPFCGGQGSLGTKHSEMWSNQMQRILQAIERLVAYLYSPCGVTSTVNEAEVVSGQALPLVDTDNSIHSLKQAAFYLHVYLTSAQTMLSTPCTASVSLPLKRLLSAICRVAEVTPDSVVFRRQTGELEAVQQSLPSLHNAAMSLLSAVSTLCRSGIYPYLTSICDLLTAQLEWTKAMFTDSPLTKYVECRIRVYVVITDIMRQPGLHSLFSNMADTLVAHALRDIHSAGSSSQKTAGAVEPKNSHLTHKATPTASSTTLLSPIKRELVAHAFQTVECLLKYLASSMSTRALQLTYDELVEVTSTVQNTLSPTCYSVDSTLRLSLYKALVSSVFSYNRQMGPLTHIATRLVAKAMTDADPQVRTLCADSLLVCQLAAQPRAPPIVQHLSAFPESKALPADSSQLLTQPDSSPHRSSSVLSEIQASDDTSHYTVTQSAVPALSPQSAVPALSPPSPSRVESPAVFLPEGEGHTGLSARGVAADSSLGSVARKDPPPSQTDDMETASVNEDDVQLSRQSYVVDQETEGTEATEEDPALMDMLNSFVPGSPDSTGGK